jgi:hypothetical protein
MVKDVWDTAQLCELQFAAWRETLWNDIRTDLMEEGAKSFVKEVSGPLDGCPSWDPCVMKGHSAVRKQLSNVNSETLSSECAFS